MITERKIREEIFKKIKEFSKLKKKKNRFIPGKSQIPYAQRIYNQEELINLVSASLDFWLTTGKFTEEFEEKLADFLGLKHCIFVNSGSSANLLAVSSLTSPLLKKRKLNSGDEVITTACGFPTTLNPIIQNNLIPVFIDIDLGTYNIQVDNLEKAITKKTKAIFIAHTLGNPVSLDTIVKIVEKHGLWFIEDNCDSLGSRYKDRYTGTFGHISTCSFYPSHIITTGEGGAVLTNNDLLKRIIISLRDWGRDCWCKSGQDNTCKKRFSWKLGSLPFGYDHKYIYSHIGYNLKATDLQASIGCAQIEKLPSFIEIRKKNFLYLYNHLKKYEEYFLLPQATQNSEPCWFGFPIFIKKEAPFRRSDIVNYLEKNKISTRMLFGGNLIRQPAYKRIRYRIIGSLQNTEKVMNNLFWIGVYPGLNEEMLKYIVKVFDNFVKKYARYT
ncbi:MAG: lipopolysaccharide biosynthesis protein RfbH [Candidatus Omnitrophica bacterium]|nr:lipopolysaccharide biosynthesis protein RfbH [Candidatus Omnitrophota bacterium]